MPKYQITAEFSLASEIEPEGLRLAVSDYAEDFQDNSYWGTASVDSDGGNVEFTVEAEDEDRAVEKSEEVVYEGMEVEDRDGRTWVVMGISVSAEAIAWEPTIEEAAAVLEDFVANYLDSDNDLHARVAKAAEVVLQGYGNRIRSLEARLLEADERITGLSRRLQEAVERIEFLSSKLGLAPGEEPTEVA